ncbi:flavin reductase family protein [Evtepia sp.]|uniref:flavin reductase family protein n=1 Tax=Evtepia sp. TaxID=2773933 RepID=UPI003F135CF6
MRKNFSDIGFFPQPVLVIGTYDEAGVPNAMNVGWGGMCGSRYVNINISRRHKTTDNIFSKKAFTMSFADQAHLVEADYFGLISGAEENKIEKAGFHTLKSEFVDAPIFEELPLTLECKVIEMTETLGVIRIVGEVLNMSADESILGDDGLVDADKLQALSFDRVRKVYRTLGGVVGQAYAAGKKLL